MPPTKVILLACGSFNPPTYMHLRMFEIAKDHLHRLGNHVVVGGLISPVHDSYGKKELEASTHRLTMVKLALQSSDWIKLSDWECKQETWSRTKQVLQYHQNQLNAILHPSKNQYDNMVNENDITWAAETLRNGIGNLDNVQVKLLCGADLLESFGTPGLWANEDIEAIVGQHGLVVITRSKSNPQEFIYNTDLLTKYMSNITIVTEWITNEVSSTKIRRALRRSESVKYLIPEKVMDYIQENALFGFKKSEYLNPFEYNSNYLTPSPSDIAMESLNPSPTTNCLMICNKSLFSQNQINEKHLQIDTPDGISKSSTGMLKHPGQAVKIITESSGDHRVIKNSPSSKEVCREEIKKRTMSISKSCTNFDEADTSTNLKHGIGKSNLKECISCDENLIKFIFTKHGIQVISDVETVV